MRIQVNPVPPDYLERVYAGVLGKLIGVYLGRPFEGWPYRGILAQLGPISYYVHDRLNQPLVVTDDDVSGTFTFVHALDEHGVSPNISSEAVGKTWLNNIVELETIFWWGGKGVSTEHTAYLNLKNGIAAPKSGAIATNGKTVAEQVGAQIFIDGWAMTAPGNPSLAARFAQAAGSVSHDGESVNAAKVWAAMEAEAFVSKDVDHLLDTGLRFIPAESKIAILIADIRSWVKEDNDWKKTRQRIEDKYGYNNFYGVCHVIPNHGLMVMALLYAGDDFHKAMHIVNTSGWDTDCNSGNLACLLAIMHGLAGFEGGPDWRGPLADRAMISSADGGYSINNAARIAYDIANFGRQLAGQHVLAPPKKGAQYHFTLPESVQGFRVSPAKFGVVEQGTDGEGRSGLAIHFTGLTPASNPVEVLTDTFYPRDLPLGGQLYNLMASPLVYPGQTVRAVVRTDSSKLQVRAQILVRIYRHDDVVIPILGGTSYLLVPGIDISLEWTIPESLSTQPICAIGIALTPEDPTLCTDGTVWLDHLGWSGTPKLTFALPEKTEEPLHYWQKAWVKSVDEFHTRTGPAFMIAKSRGEGILSIGTREWTDYRVKVDKFRINIGGPVGVIARVRGLKRWYGLVFMDSKGKKTLAIVKARDDKRTVLKKVNFEWELDEAYEVSLIVQGSRLSASVDEVKLGAVDEDDVYESGGIGLFVYEGSLSAGQMRVEPVCYDRQ